MLLQDQLAALAASDWAPFLAAECAKPYFAELDAFVSEAAAARTVYPAPQDIFAAFAACPARGIRAVILGQDPYHEPGQAMGLAFSVPDGCKTPPSLRNIHKELETEFGPAPAPHNDLTPWARQGVLLLNTVLTVEAGKAFSHAGHGWDDLFEKPKRKHHRTHPQAKRCLAQRPQTADQRSEIGHWELDTVQGQKNGNDSVVLVMTDRLS